MAMITLYYASHTRQKKIKCHLMSKKLWFGADCAFPLWTILPLWRDQNVFKCRLQVTYDKWRYKSNPKFPSPQKVKQAYEYKSEYSSTQYLLQRGTKKMAGIIINFEGIA